MSYLNYSTREISFKIVYFGPGLCGKTTNIKIIYDKVKNDCKGKLVCMANETERTIFFDYFPLELGTVRGYKVRFHLYATPGQIYYSSSRKLIMNGVDGVVFVADSQKERLDANIESLNDLFYILREHQTDFQTLPYVLQLNKRDLPNGLTANEMIERLRKKDEPIIEAVALKGDGVVETLKAISRLVMADVKRKLAGGCVSDPSVLTHIKDKSEALKNFDHLLESSRAPRIPLEIANKGIYAIADYFKSLRNKKKCFEAKLILVGGGSVGKTSLMKRLLFNEFTPGEAITQGIEINNWLLDTEIANNLRINCWDFGGQEIFHATHQFFLTKRTLYIYVWEARKDDDLINFDYWLNIIRILSDESPIIIVLNKIDENIKLLDEAALKKKFRNIAAFFQVSARTGAGIEDLRRFIRREIIKLPHIGNTISQLWLEIRDNLEKLEENYIECAQYREICKTFGLDNDAADLLSQYLHDLGIFLHFRDNPILKDLIFLKPHWATGAVYKLVNTNIIRERGGKFSFSDLNAIWPNYPDNKYIFLLELMKRFELCFQVPNSQEYILPQLLPPNEPDTQWNYKNNIRFEYHYDFMPSGIMARFIVRNNDLIHPKWRWQNGAVLNWENSTALIIAEPLAKKIHIRIRGTDPKIFLDIIRRDMDVIHRSLNFPQVTEFLPCICPECRDNDNPHLFDYAVLKNFKAKGREYIYCHKSADQVLVDQLLNGVERVFTIEEMETGGLKRILSDDHYKSESLERIKTISIFLASSSSLKEERERIELELSRKNSLLISRNIYLDLKIWEKAPSGFSATRKQDDFNRMALESDIFICIIADRLGEFTREEFNIAYHGFLYAQRPRKIYVYFRDTAEAAGEISQEQQRVRDFKDQILRYGQCFNVYDNPEGLLLQINKNLELDVLIAGDDKQADGAAH